MEIGIKYGTDYSSIEALLKSDFRANGEVLTYHDPVPHPSAVVVGGNWNFLLKNEKIDFKLFCKTLNLLPDLGGSAPTGSVDQFKISLVDTYYLDFKSDEHVYFFYGKFSIDTLTRLSKDLSIKKECVYNYLGDMKGWVYINSTYIELDVWPLYIIGSTNLFYVNIGMESV